MLEANQQQNISKILQDKLLHIKDIAARGDQRQTLEQQLNHASTIIQQRFPNCSHVVIGFDRDYCIRVAVQDIDDVISAYEQLFPRWCGTVAPVATRNNSDLTSAYLSGEITGKPEIRRVIKSLQSIFKTQVINYEQTLIVKGTQNYGQYDVARGLISNADLQQEKHRRQITVI